MINYAQKYLSNNKTDTSIRKPIIAIAYFSTDIIRYDKGPIKGTVKFTELNDLVQIDIDISGLKPNAQHGFHVHESGDLTDHCVSMCAHFNPYNKQHGSPGNPERHVGDLGNLLTDGTGCAKYTQTDNVIKLCGIANIIGRGLIIHADPDDLGKGVDELRLSSLTTGNSGARIACAIIGYSKENFKK